MSRKFITQHLLLLAGVCLMVACRHKKPPRQQVIVKNVKELHEAIPENIAERLSYMSDNNGIMEDSVPAASAALQFFYGQHKNVAQWSDNGVASRNADTMLYLVQHAMDAGLLPERYHGGALSAAMYQIKTDSNARKDAALWAKVDVMMSDAFMK